MSSIPPPGVRRVKPVNRKLLVAGGVVSAGIVYWAYKRNKQAAATLPTDSTTADDGSYYGDTGSSPIGVTPSLYGYTDQFGNTIVPGSGQTVVTAPSTNAAWAQQAASLLANQGMYDAATAYGTLGLYVGSGGKVTLSDSQYALVEAAYGLVGKPPEPIDLPHKAAPTGQSSTSLGAAPKLTLGPHRKGAATLSWTQTTGATSYHLHRNGILVNTVTSRAVTVKSAGVYQVFAVGAGGMSKGSNILTWTGK